MHPFLEFILFILLSLSGVVFCILSVLMVMRMVTKIYEGVMFEKLKYIIKRSPGIGLKDEDGNLVFKQGGFVLKYRLIALSSPAGEKKIEIIAREKKLWAYERNFDRVKKAFRDFWLYSKWINLLEPRFFFPLLLTLLIFYFSVFEPQDFKIQRVRWIISRILRVDMQSVAIAPHGQVAISGKRRTAVDKQVEPISYNVNLFDWFTFKDDGYIMRNRGTDYGYANYSVIYDDNGKIDLKKEDKWIEGKFNLGEIKWKEPQGTGIREGKVLGHELDSEDNKVLINDQ
jgi:hypothetical protein